MLIPTHNHFALCGESAGKKLIVIRVITDRLGKALNWKYFRVGFNEIKDRQQLNLRKLVGKDFPHPSILVEYFR